MTCSHWTHLKTCTEVRVLRRGNGKKPASMTSRRKPIRRMRHIVEYDITSNATIRRNYVERQFVECKSVENSSKVRRKLVEK